MTKWVYSFSAERAEGRGDMKNFLGGNGSIGWGVRMLNGLYSVTHPFAGPSSAQPITASPMNAAEVPASQASPSPAP